MRNEALIIVLLSTLVVAALIWRPLRDDRNVLTAATQPSYRAQLRETENAADPHPPTSLVALQISGWPDCGYDRSFETPIQAVLRSRREDTSLWHESWSGFARGDDRRALVLYAPERALREDALHLELRRCPPLSDARASLACESGPELTLSIEASDAQLENAALVYNLTEAERDTLNVQCSAP